MCLSVALIHPPLQEDPRFKLGLTSTLQYIHGETSYSSKHSRLDAALMNMRTGTGVNDWQNFKLHNLERFLVLCFYNNNY
jgi:hypothetical protein